MARMLCGSSDSPLRLRPRLSQGKARDLRFYVSRAQTPSGKVEMVIIRIISISEGTSAKAQTAKARAIIPSPIAHRPIAQLSKKKQIEKTKLETRFRKFPHPHRRFKSLPSGIPRAEALVPCTPLPSPQKANLIPSKHRSRENQIKSSSHSNSKAI